MVASIYIIQSKSYEQSQQELFPNLIHLIHKSQQSPNRLELTLIRQFKHRLDLNQAIQFNLEELRSAVQCSVDRSINQSITNQERVFDLLHLLRRHRSGPVPGPGPVPVPYLLLA